MEKDSNYIFLPLIGVFVSILAFLIESEDGTFKELFPYILLFILSVVDIYRDIRDDDDGYYQVGSRSNTPSYNYNSNANTGYVGRGYSVVSNELSKDESTKLLKRLNKNKTVKISTKKEENGDRKNSKK